MGNNPSSPICSRLCPGSTRPPLQDDGEWFDTGTKKTKAFRKTAYQKPVPKMAAVPEESESNDDGAYPECSETTALTYTWSEDAESNAGSNKSGSSETENDPSEPRRHSDGQDLRKALTDRKPKAKLTFVNGQFLDLKKSEGKEMAAAAKALESGQVSSSGGLRRNEISGIEASIYAGHGGILPASSGHRKGGSKSRSTTLRSDSASRCSDASFKTVSSSGSSQEGVDSDGHNAVTSIVCLGQAGDGYFLTASKYDRVIKLWRAKDISEETGPSASNIEFVRDFVGHNTGVTSLTRIDDKGRFLSASKDGSVILWDSRYDTGDDEEDELENRILLSRFEKMDRRALTTIAITEQGEYVRPDDDVDFAMLKAVARKTLMGGAAGLQQAAKDRQIIGCSCEFATITGHHNTVKIWSIQQIDNQEGMKAGENCAEVHMEQEIKNDYVVQALASVLGHGMILTGDRMGNIKLWRGGKSLLGASKAYVCERTFSSKTKKLCSVEDVMNSSISSLSFLSDDIFASGTRGGDLRLWTVESDKDLVSINGAHQDELVDIKLGSFMEKKKKAEKNLLFSSASADGKVLSFSVTLMNDKCRPFCYDVVHHGIASRYFSNRNPASVEALECLDIPMISSCDSRKVMISTCSGGDINILKAQMSPHGTSKDALLLYREQIEEEALTLHAIAPDLLRGVEIRDRKRHMLKYKQCFLGHDAVTFLVEKGHALTRKDALDLGRILASHFSLFYHVSAKDKLLEDDDGFYRFSDESNGKWGDMKKQHGQRERAASGKF